MLSEPYGFSYNYLVKNYLIMSQTEQDGFVVLKCYLISRLGRFAVGSVAEPQVTWGCAAAPA